jgi:NADH-quinone oxidoreductase subunit H
MFFFMFSWIWATVPRYRYDQLMRLGWKIFLPMSLLFVAAISGYLMAIGHFERAPAFEPDPAAAPPEFVETMPAQPVAVKGQP